MESSGRAIVIGSIIIAIAILVIGSAAIYFFAISPRDEKDRQAAAYFQSVCDHIVDWRQDECREAVFRQTGITLHPSHR